ncbi:MAG: cytochrome c oxidase subunit 3 [Gaiellaceae bacterium]
MTNGAEIRPAYAVEDFEIGARNVALVSQLGAAAQTFFFVAFLFAFFYLRALNTNGRWNAHHIHPSRAYGIAILICVLASVGAAWLGAWSTRTANVPRWRAGMSAAILLALAAVGLQSAEYANLGFGPGDGSFPSVFVGWTGLYIVNVLAVIYWLTTLLSESFNRLGRPIELIRPTAEGLALYWGVLGLVELGAFLLLYVVR